MYLSNSTFTLVSVARKNIMKLLRFDAIEVLCEAERGKPMTGYCTYSVPQLIKSTEHCTQSRPKQHPKKKQ